MRHLALGGLLFVFSLNGAMAQQEFPKEYPPLQQPLHIQIKPFAPLYARYVRATQSHNLAEMKRLLTPDFAIVGGDSPIRGKQAVKFMVNRLDGLKIKKYTVKIYTCYTFRHVSIGSHEIAEAEVETQGKRVKKVISSNWTHIWRNTSRRNALSGWRLQSIQRDDYVGKYLDKMDKTKFILTAHAGSG